MICYHSINGITTNNLKGASMNQQQFSFPTNELSLLTKSLELSRLYIERNKEQFQDSQDMLQKINSAINIISSKTKKKNQQQQRAPTLAIKGASAMNGLQSLINIRRRFGLSKGNQSVMNQLKGASQNNICSKKKSLINIREHFNLV
jgi:hypothetical protein